MQGYTGKNRWIDVYNNQSNPKSVSLYVVEPRIAVGYRVTLVAPWELGYLVTVLRAYSR